MKSSRQRTVGNIQAMTLWMPGRQDRNWKLPVRFPVGAGLAHVVDWEHPILKTAGTGTPEARLLHAWRRELGYIFFFARCESARIATAVPAEEAAQQDKLLDNYRRWLTGRRPQEIGPLRLHGNRLHWRCYTRRNQEFVCHVNRFSWLPGMAMAALRRGPRHHEVPLAVIDDWLAACPPPEQLILWRERPWKYWYHPWAPLNTALRVKFWTFVLHLLWDSPALTPERFGRLVVAIRQHMLFLGRIPPRLDKQARGNHFLMESEGLLLSSLLPWLKEARRARTAALHNLTRCFDRQILPDGVHCERTPGYHRGCMQWFALPLLLARLNGWPVPRRCETRLGGMLDFGLHCVQPDGGCAAMGDSGAHGDGWTSERIVARALGTGLPVTPPRPSAFLSMLQRLPRLRRGGAGKYPLAAHFKWGGFAAARGSWAPDASAIVMKLDGYGGGHSHGDFLSFVLTLRGHRVVEDRGVWAYDNDRRSVACKSAAAHNVLLLGKRELLEMGPEPEYFQKRPPCVNVRDVSCRPGRDGSLRAAGRIVWPDGAWWHREVVFAPAGRLTVRDSFETPSAQGARLQFFLSGAGWRLGTDGICRSPAGFPVRVAVRLPSGARPAVRLLGDSTYPGPLRERPATRLELRSAPALSGCWEITFEAAD